MFSSKTLKPKDLSPCYHQISSRLPSISLWFWNYSVAVPSYSSSRWLKGNEICLQCSRCEFDPWVGKIPRRRKWQSAPVFLPEKSHGQRSLAGYCPWDRKRVRHDLETQFSSVQSLSRVRLFATPWIATHQTSLSVTNSQSLLKLMSIESVMPPRHLILLSPSPPALNPSQHQGLFQWVYSSHEVAKVLEFQLQRQFFQWTPRTDLLYDGLVGSPCSPRDSQESSPTPPFKSINSSVPTDFLHSPTLTSIHDHWKNHSLDQTDLCWQSNVSAF